MQDDYITGLLLLFGDGIVIDQRGCWLFGRASSKTNDYGSITITASPWELVDVVPGLRAWDKVRGGERAVKMDAHRYVAMVKYGDLGKGILARHTCDVRRCINPDHIIIGTAKDNADDRSERGRSWWQNPDMRQRVLAARARPLTI